MSDVNISVAFILSFEYTCKTLLKSALSISMYFSNELVVPNAYVVLYSKFSVFILVYEGIVLSKITVEKIPLNTFSSVDVAEILEA